MQVKYDRQLRLWEESGQRALKNAHICLINANDTGTEILKNLILGGIGKFTIVDEAGRESGFFNDLEYSGNNRGESVLTKLCDLNPDAEGFIRTTLDIDFSEFNLVFFCGELTQSLIQKCAEVYSMNIPCLHAEDVGFVGSVSLSVPSHLVIDRHPDNLLYDLRISDPFNLELLDIDFQSMSNEQHSHIPWLIILVKACDIWKEGKETFLTRQDKDRFKQMIREMMRRPDEENFLEAIANAYRVFTPFKLPETVLNVLEKNQQNPSLKAISVFLKMTNHLPLSGKIPDMFSDTESFNRLRKIYANKAEMDAKMVFEIAKGHDPSIKYENVRTYCRNILQTCFVEMEPLNAIHRHDSVVQSARDGDSVAIMGLLLSTKSSEHASKLIEKDLTLFSTEFSRYSTSLHSVSCIIGAFAAQEGIKLLTSQYVPIKSLLIFNGLGNPSTTVYL